MLKVQKSISQPALFVAMVVVWLASTTLALYLKSTQLLIGFDGGYALDVARRQFAWHVPLFSASMDWFQGLGDVFFPVNFRLFPAYIAGSFFAGTIAAKVVIYGTVLCELSISIVLFGMSLGASRTVCIAAALVTCVAFLPFAHPTLIYPIIALEPHTGSLIAGALLTGAAFIQFGRRNWLADLPLAAIVFTLVGWSVLVSVATELLAAPFLLLCAISGTIAADNRSERRRKIGLFAAAALFLVAAGPTVYLASTILDTAAVNFPAELANDRASFFFASILFQWKTVGPAGPLLAIFGVAGAVLAAADRTHRTLRLFAITLLTYLGTRLTFSILIIAFDFWRGPAPLYFEFYVIPLYAVFAVLFWARMIERLWCMRGWMLPSSSVVELRLVGAAGAAVLVLAVITSKRDYSFPYPPQATPFIDILSRETGLQPGAVFRGRTANMTGRSIDRSIDWFDLHAMDSALAGTTGNELRLVGLHYFGIPGFFEYTPTISPALYAVASRLLAVPGDKQMRDVIVLRDIEPRILAMLGVRFVITDRGYNGAVSLRASVPTKDRTLLLYEIANPNLGNYSPTAVTMIATATDIIARLANQNFDPTREIIANIPGDTDGLVPARNGRLTFVGASLHLQAESDGRSILLVPLEFSRCLDASPVEGERPLLFRANLLETGILFSGRLDTSLAIRTGPFINPACRLRDLLETRALGVGAVPPRAALTQAPGN